MKRRKDVYTFRSISGEWVIYRNGSRHHAGFTSQAQARQYYEQFYR